MVLGTLALEMKTMRRIIVATLLLSPMLLHAQANSPAPPQSSSTNILQSKLVQPQGFEGSEPDHKAGSVRVSTGVSEPKLIYTVAVQSDTDFTAVQLKRTAVVAMTIDTSGKPTELKIVRSVNPTMDKNLLTAVRQYRFTPGTLDDQPISVPVNLEVVLRPAQ